MDRATYAAASDGFFQLTRLDVVNNNLANVNTPGFKKQFVVTRKQTFEDTLASKLKESGPFAREDHERTPGVTQIQTATDFSIGSFKRTDNPLDVALKNPNDFFMINTSEGVHYSRAGNFAVDQEGQLVTLEGNLVLGDGGAIVIDGPGASITSGGQVLVGDRVVGKLGVARFEDPSGLERVGGNRFRLIPGGGEPTTPEDARFIPRSLEMSNVSAIESMIDLINAARGFEMYSKSAKTIDEMNQTSITRIGKGS